MNSSKLSVQRHLPWIGAVAILLALLVGAWKGIALGVLLLAAVVFVIVLVVLGSSVSALAGDTPLSLDEAIGFGAPSAEEEQKRAILRALKDLEFERSLGKISDQDFHEFSARYRGEAKRLIAQLDGSLRPAQELAERLAAERLAKAGLTADTAVGEIRAEDAVAPHDDEEPAKTEPSNASSDDAPSADGEASTTTAATTPACGDCGTLNDPDARFCKRCGSSLGPAADSTPEDAKEA